MRLILLGLPGSGKGTQATVIAERLGLPHVSTGEMFREAAAAGSELGLSAQRFMSRGDLVPDEVTIGMLLERIAQPDAAAGYMLDGFPRTIAQAQAQALDAALAQRGVAIEGVLYLELPEPELVARLSGRRICDGCGAIYHLVHHPPRDSERCDNCGGALQQREDDRPDAVQRRLDVNREPTEALAEHYAHLGRLRRVDGSGEPSQVTERLLAAIESVSAAAQAMQKA